MKFEVFTPMISGPIGSVEVEKVVGKNDTYLALEKVLSTFTFPEPEALSVSAHPGYGLAITRPKSGHPFGLAVLYVKPEAADLSDFHDGFKVGYTTAQKHIASKVSRTLEEASTSEPGV